MSERKNLAQKVLEEAVVELGLAIMAEDESGDEPAILTQFVVLSSWMMTEDVDGHERHRYMRMLSDNTMPLHHLAGLIQLAHDHVREDWG